MLGGAPLAVSAIRRAHSGWRFGYLYMSLSHQPPLWWESRRGEIIDVPPPIEIRRVRVAEGKERWRVKSRLFRIIEFSADGTDWQLAVPTIDLPLVKQAFAEATRRV
jgi:hypothetical protein